MKSNLFAISTKDIDFSGVRNNSVTEPCMIHIRHEGPRVCFRIVFLHTLEYCVTSIIVCSSCNIQVSAERDNS